MNKTIGTIKLTQTEKGLEICITGDLANNCCCCKDGTDEKCKCDCCTSEETKKD